MIGLTQVLRTAVRSNISIINFGAFRAVSWSIVSLHNLFQKINEFFEIYQVPMIVYGVHDMMNASTWIQDIFRAWRWENESEVTLSQRKRKVFIILMKIAGLYDSTLFALLPTLVWWLDCWWAPARQSPSSLFRSLFRLQVIDINSGILQNWCSYESPWSFNNIFTHFRRIKNILT